MGDIVISIFFIILSIYMYISSLGFKSGFTRGSVGADGFPKIIAVAILVLAVINLIRTLKKKKISFEFSKEKFLEKYKPVLMILLMFAIYVFSMKYIGFIITTILFMFSTQWYLSDRSKKNIPKIIILTLFISLGAYFFFTSYLTVVFPAGIFFD
jgi:hypothetical protein